MFRIDYCPTPTVEKTQVRNARINTRVNEQALIIEFAFPGFSKEQLSIELEDRCLVVKTKVSANHDSPEEKMHFRYREFSPQARMQRRILIPTAFDLNQIKAQMAQGVLRVEIAKNHKTHRSIEVL